MNDFDAKDRVLDACLDEVLAARTPPDLTTRILQAWASRSADLTEPAPPPVQASSASSTPSPFSQATPDVEPAIELPLGRPLLTSAKASNGSDALRARRRSESRIDWQPTAIIAASVLGIGVLVSVAAVVLNGPEPVVATNGSKADKPSQRSTAARKTDRIQQANPAGPSSAGSNNIAKSRPANSKGPTNQEAVALAPPSAAVHNIPSGSNSSASDSPNVETTVPNPTQPTYVNPSPDREVVSFVNASLASTWVASGVTPSPLATDAEWCRRLYLRLLGRTPRAEELKRFTGDSAKSKREALVDLLLTDETYAAEYSSHWAAVLTNVLIGRTGGQGDSTASREGLEQYLRQSLAANKPYHEIVQELLTATGSGKPGTKDYNGAANFLLASLNKDATLATSRVARLFLGHQLQCAQCHNHPSQDWKQEQFWSLNAFFRQMSVEREDGAAKLVNVDFAGEGKNSTEGEVFYETPTGLLKTAFPKFIDGTELPPSGAVAEVDRRKELARLVLASPQFPRAVVNRLWAHFFGYGFTPAVDDLGASVSHPELLDRLAAEFAAHNFDLKRLLRWIALSDPFSRSSRLTHLVSKDMPEAGEVALFSRYYARQMQAEEVYNSLAQAAAIRRDTPGGADVEKARVEWLAQFQRRMGTDDAEEESHFNGNLQQSLIMMNGELMRRAASSKHEGLLRTVAQSKMRFEEKVSHLFLSAVAREPLRRELDVAIQIRKSAGGDEAAALEDVWWALLNSNEFILDH